MKEYVKWNFILDKNEIYAGDLHIIGWKKNNLTYSMKLMKRSWLVVIVFNIVYFIAVLISKSLIFPTSMLLFPWITKNLNIPDPIIGVIAIVLGFLVVQKLEKNEQKLPKDQMPANDIAHGLT